MDKSLDIISSDFKIDSTNEVKQLDQLDQKSEGSALLSPLSVSNPLDFKAAPSSPSQRLLKKFSHLTSSKLKNRSIQKKQAGKEIAKSALQAIKLTRKIHKKMDKKQIAKSIILENPKLQRFSKIYSLFSSKIKELGERTDQFITKNILDKLEGVLEEKFSTDHTYIKAKYDSVSSIENKIDKLKIRLSYLKSDQVKEKKLKNRIDKLVNQRYRCLSSIEKYKEKHQLSLEPGELPKLNQKKKQAFLNALWITPRIALNTLHWIYNTLKSPKVLLKVISKATKILVTLYSNIKFIYNFYEIEKVKHGSTKKALKATLLRVTEVIWNNLDKISKSGWGLMGIGMGSMLATGNPFAGYYFIMGASILGLGLTLGMVKAGIDHFKKEKGEKSQILSDLYKHIKPAPEAFLTGFVIGAILHSLVYAGSGKETAQWKDVSLYFDHFAERLQLSGAAVISDLNIDYLGVGDIDLAVDGLEADLAAAQAFSTSFKKFSPEAEKKIIDSLERRGENIKLIKNLRYRVKENSDFEIKVEKDLGESSSLEIVLEKRRGEKMNMIRSTYQGSPTNLSKEMIDHIRKNRKVSPDDEIVHVKIDKKNDLSTFYITQKRGEKTRNIQFSEKRSG